MKKNNNISDAALIESYQSGNKKALSLLVERWHTSFCRLSFFYVKDADVAKDIAQECWSTIIRKINTIQEPEKFKSWAISLVNRRSIDWIRANNRERNKLYEFHKENQVNSVNEETTQKEKQKLKLLHAIQSLTVDQQYVIRLFYLQNYSLKEIAEIVGISVGTAKSRLFHAREKLKLIVKNKDDEK
ncbi:RNA polymerase sigma factor [Pseudotenacibaculum sp. MALMAid0570]|uniref:RNA polymerase sigma factor n=1 Tax=Pseudotenacibaculum sp. MALMAid0570 TaxID=3143938 RepID=UPI0032DF2F50